MAKSILLFTLFFTYVFCIGQNAFPILSGSTYFDKILAWQKDSLTFKEDSENGFIKIGKFIDSTRKNALVIAFDSANELSVFSLFELKNHDWVSIYHQTNVGFGRFNSIEVFIADYNFDGVNDIGILNEVSNGTSIMTFHLWLADKNSFKYVPEFEDIGSPIVYPKRKIIQGFHACCVFKEMNLSWYTWHGKQFVKTSELAVSNYPAGIEAHFKDQSWHKSKRVKISQKDISTIIETYSGKWSLVDSSANPLFPKSGWKNTKS